MINSSKHIASSIYFFILIANLGILLSLMDMNNFRYLIYSPLILGLYFIGKNELKFFNIGLKRNSLNTAFLILIINGLFHFPVLNITGISQLIFILCSLLPVIVFKNFKVNWRLISIIYASSFTVYLLYNGVNVDFSLEAFYTSSSSTLETNQHPFVFGILALFFLYKRDRLFFLINFFFVILSFKRIVFLAVLISIPIVLLERKNIRILKNKRWFFLIINFLALRFLYLFTYGNFDDIVNTVTGLSTGHFSMGRNTIYEMIFEYYTKYDFFEILFGKGQGNTYSLTTSSYIEDAPHNDLLVILLDHGVLFFSIFFSLIYAKKNIIFNVVYLNVLFLSDNVLIYAFFLFPFLLINNEINK